MVNIGYLGPAGTFSHEAAEYYLSSGMASGIQADVSLHERSTISSLVAAVSNRTLDECVLPVENSWEGAVNLALDSLMNQPNIWIKGELIIPIQHCLLAAQPLSINEIVKVVSHPQALAQCRGFLEKIIPQEQWLPTNSTAEAAKLVTSNPGWVAIGSKRAAEVYQLCPIVSNIQDGNVNETRFVILSLSDSEITGNDKTSLIFSVPHRPGSLYHILAEFAQRDINLCKIESRPAKTRLGEYFFFVDIEGHRNETNVGEAIQSILKLTGTMRVLGSYPRFDKSC